MANRLINESSPYLLQHADQPVNWFPWGEEAFAYAKQTDRPVFLSIGYSTCHWCHVMSRESFSDSEIAEILNRHFVSVKVDKEERPDIDMIYMRVCQTLTGSGGWPTSIFMTADQKPFYAGTYFPKQGDGRFLGFRELLTSIAELWRDNRDALLYQADQLLQAVRRVSDLASGKGTPGPADPPIKVFERAFDPLFGGFGRAPKFPTAQNLMYLLRYGKEHRDNHASYMAEKTLLQMYLGGLFDHIGGGFCRYATDRMFLVPHFEKMLYDNALLISAYCRASQSTTDSKRSELFLSVAERTGEYVLRELNSPDGGFYSAQDADSEGEEGKYYLFTKEELIGLLGAETADSFCLRYHITPKGNFEGKNIPNLIGSDPYDTAMDSVLPEIDAYRKRRWSLSIDHKILTAWNGLMIAALCELYRCTKNRKYLDAAKNADACLNRTAMQGEDLFVSVTGERRGARGFLDDYAGVLYGKIALYDATLDLTYLEQGKKLWEKIHTLFSDEAGGFFFSDEKSENLILRPKETSEGAIPGGNSLMANLLVRLAQMTGDEALEQAAERQLLFLSGAAASDPMSHGMYLLSKLMFDDPLLVTVHPGEGADISALPMLLPMDASVRVLSSKSDAGKQTTYQLCRNRQCKPPAHNLAELGKMLSESSE